jgi:hypothetical protein
VEFKISHFCKEEEYMLRQASRCLLATAHALANSLLRLPPRHAQCLEDLLLALPFDKHPLV